MKLSLLMWMCLASCYARNAPDASPKEVRVYTVPAGTARDLKVSLSNLGYTGKDQSPALTVETLPDERVAVYADRHMQEGVADIVKGLSAASTSQSIETKVWQVVARPSDKTSIEPALAALSPQLEEVTKTYGPMAFTLYYPATVRASSGETGMVRSNLGEVRVRAVTRGADKIFADVVFTTTFESKYSLNFNATFQLATGKSVVVAQNGATSGDSAKREAFTLFTVVQAQILNQ
jgi:hypothetical protein